jgi:hypothetical protein
VYAKKNVTQDTYHQTISKMDEFEINHIFNELNTILEITKTGVKKTNRACCSENI